MQAVIPFQSDQFTMHRRTLSLYRSYIAAKTNSTPATTSAAALTSSLSKGGRSFMRELYARFIKVRFIKVDRQPFGKMMAMMIKKGHDTFGVDKTGCNELKASELSIKFLYPLGQCPMPDYYFVSEISETIHETFERDSVKYKQYQRAICKALLDRVPAEEASTTTVLMVVGDGCGPLVLASLQAAEEAGRKLKVYAVEKNPNAVVKLHGLAKHESWEGIVTIISCDMRYCDMRYWDVPEKADIMVSEWLGSFSDNELSPECLDGAQRFLKPDGISIPSSYTSFLQPVMAPGLYDHILQVGNRLIHFEWKRPISELMDADRSTLYQAWDMSLMKPS